MLDNVKSYNPKPLKRTIKLVIATNFTYIEKW